MAPSPVPPGICEVKDGEIDRIAGFPGTVSGAILFWRMADLLFSQASAHGPMLHTSKKVTWVCSHNNHIYIQLAVLHICTCFL
jgi:hypothetical protein